MKWLLSLLIGLIGCLHAGQLSVDVNAQYAVLINADSGVALFAKNESSSAFPASVTKIATALYLLEEKKVDLQRVVEVSAESLRMKRADNDLSAPAYWLERDGSGMGLRVGERISIESLLHGLMLVSANDAANVLAEAASGSVPVFMDELNQYLQRIGCRDTHFCSPHGLHHPEHRTTAHDMGLITRRALQNERFGAIVAQTSYLKPRTNKNPERRLQQYNALLCPGKFFYPEAIGVKTGYTHAAQYNLVAAVLHEGRTLVAVVLGCKSRNARYKDALKLFHAAFAEQKVHRVLFTSRETFGHQVEGATAPLVAGLGGELALDVYPAEAPGQLKAQIVWAVPELPIAKGAKVAQMRIVDGDGTVQTSADLFAQSEVAGSWSFRLKKFCLKLFFL